MFDNSNKQYKQQITISLFIEKRRSTVHWLFLKKIIR